MSVAIAAATAAALYPTVIETASQVSRTIAGNAIKAQSDRTIYGNSLPEYTQPARLTPIVLIDKKVLVVDPKLTTALLQTLLSLYTGYYLMAVNMEMNVGEVKVMDILDKFSTNRDNVGVAATGMFANAFMSNAGFSKEEIDDELSNLPTYGLESDQKLIEHASKMSALYTYGLESNPYTGAGGGSTPVGPSGKIFKKNKDPNSIPPNNTPRNPTNTTGQNSNSTIGATTGNVAKTKKEEDDKRRDLTDTRRYDFDKEIHTIMDESNLAVGKIINVTINNGKSFVTIPVMATLIPKSIDSADFLDISRVNNIDGSVKGRYHQWRSGEIRFVKDYMLCLDLIEADKKALLADKTGSLLSIRKKHSAGIAKAAVTGKFSPNEVSAMVIISKQTASDLEYILKGSLKQLSVRQQYFNSNSTMMLVVVDVTMERFTIYQRGISDYADYTLDDIKGNASKSNGVSITDVLKAYSQGSMPNI